MYLLVFFQNIILEKNFRVRDNLRKLHTIPSNEEKIKFINGYDKLCFSKKTKKTFSALRLTFDEDILKIQKDSFNKLTLKQKNIIKQALHELIDEIDLLADGVN